MLVRNSERSKMLFEKLDGMSSDPAWVRLAAVLVS